MKNWQQILQSSVTTTEQLSKFVQINTQQVEQVIQHYPMKINPYFLKLAIKKGPSLLRQVLPDIRELYDDVCQADPLGEEKNSPVPNLIHRYRDRVLLMVSQECAIYCRFCTRKRRVGRNGFKITRESIEKGIDYIKRHREVRDVLISGGDPLLLSDEQLDWILAAVRDIRHVEIVRIGSRVPSALPQRVTPHLAKVLRKYHPLYLNIHFNHPDEITKESSQACQLLADAGIPLGSQTVLLRGINDNAEVLAALMKKLLAIRVRPYYLFQADPVKGISHLRTSIEVGIHLIEKLRANLSGMAVPDYVVDVPGNGGKIPLLPQYLVELNEKEAVLRSYQGEIYSYPQKPDLHPSAH